MISRTGIQLGPLSIHFYGLIIMIGALLAAWLTSRQAKKRGDKGELVWDFLPWILIAGIIGARLWHVFTPTDSNQSMGLTTSYYFSNPIAILRVWDGGLGIPGALIGGILALYYFCKKKGMSFSAWADYIAPGLALAQAIGRWGNFVNQELYGSPTNLPWKLFIEPQYRIPGYQDVEYYHPLFLYESLLNLIIMGILLWVSAKFADKLKKGDVFLLYVVMYPLVRFFLEFLCLDASSIAGLNANQTFMGILVVASIALLIIRHKTSVAKKEEQRESGESSQE